MDPLCRIEKLLPAYNLEDLEAHGNPIACFTVHIGTDVSNVEYDVSITAIKLIMKPY